MKKFLNIFLRVLMIVLVYLLQMYAFNKYTFYGVKANLVLMFLACIAITKNTRQSVIYALCFGILTDILFMQTLGKNVIIYSIITILLLGLKGTYNGESKWTIIIFATVATALYELLFAIFNLIAGEGLMNVLAFFMLIIKECVINIFLAYVIYIILEKISKSK